ncbi:hypothetical protein JQ560_47830 [Bradyrhizobium liaoningense]|nr:hypothetical protein [Bradyrhizobium liaoningense]MBR1033996.1 hypothetical protein [Bradyrhizobium liaoningense]
MNAGECVRRLFFVIFAPDSQQESSPLSGRKSTQATVRICGASSRVYWFFRTILKCEADVADTLTRLSTYRKRLPTGSPLSPFLAYFAYSDTWEKVASVARTHGLTLTVYVDDVTLSGRRVPRKIVWEIQKVIHASGLRYHKEKTYFDRAAEITGVIVDRDRLLAPQRQHRKLHLAKANLARAHGKERTAAVAKISGLQGQMKQISDGLPDSSLNH